MDKETLSNYGWIVICTLVLAVMIALATPFGEYIKDGVWSITHGFNDTLDKNMEIVGLSGSGDEDTGFGDDILGDDIGENLNSVSIKYNQKYVATKHHSNEYVGSTYVFYEDGSATFETIYGIKDTAPAGRFSCINGELYQEDEGVVGQITDYGNTILLDDGNVVLVLESTMSGLRFGQRYVIYEGDDPISYAFYEDGSALAWYDDITDAEEIPAGYLAYTDTEIIVPEEDNYVLGEILENGTKINFIDDEVYLILVSAISAPETPVQLGGKYVNYDENIYVTFYADTSVKIFDMYGEVQEYFPMFAFKYEGNRIYSEEYELDFIVSADGQTVTLDDMVFVLSDLKSFFQFGEKYIYTDGSRDLLGQYMIFNKNSIVSSSPDAEPSTIDEVRYAFGYVEELQSLVEVVAVPVRYNGEIKMWLPIAWATDDGHIYVLSETQVLTREALLQPSATFTDGTTLSWAELKSKYNVTDTAIGANAFQNCTTLKNIILPDTIKTIGDYAFNGCTSLSQICMSFTNITSIGDQAFAGCTSLKVVTLPNSCASLGAQVFANCTSLITVLLPSELTTIPSYAFKNCSSLEDIDFENCQKLTTIGYGAFYNCTSLDSVYEAPVTLKTIGNGAFQGCTEFDYFRYSGTAEQWSNITKGENWYSDTALTYVSCSDNSVYFS
jgi:hypothetical protein